MHEAVFNGRMILEGKWLELTEHVTRATGYSAKYLIGYDPKGSIWWSSTRTTSLPPPTRVMRTAGEMEY